MVGPQSRRGGGRMGGWVGSPPTPSKNSLALRAAGRRLHVRLRRRPVGAVAPHTSWLRRPVGGSMWLRGPVGGSTWLQRPLGGSVWLRRPVGGSAWLRPADLSVTRHENWSCLGLSHSETTHPHLKLVCLAERSQYQLFRTVCGIKICGRIKFWWGQGIILGS